ncbi:MAG: tetratricopeptide repeat protein [Paludibacter sp.]|nr:tetratricopeptide repeat protein [Paludibacter sp.]
MERKKYFITLLLILFSFSVVNASHKSDIYKAYISNNMTLWQKVIDEMNLQKIKSNELRLELLNYQYGYIAWCIGNKKKESAEHYIQLGEANIAVLEKLGHIPSLINSYKSAFYGYKIGLNKLKAPFIGPKSVDCAKLAIKQDDKNPYGYIQFGNSQYYMPSAFGGSKTEALKYYIKAEKLLELNQNQLKEDWNYLSLLTMIAKAYTDLNDYQHAKAYYTKILNIEPNYLWVKNKLFPELLKKINQKV